MSTPKQTRGIRNHNPLNIRVSRDSWMGEVPADEKKDAAFEEFINPLFGLRAACKILIKYFTVYHLDTLSKIIHRWAPPNENDTAAYVAAVVKDSGLRPDEHLTVDGIPAFIPGMVKVENAGQQPYSVTLIQQAYQMAKGGK